jgi:hypothetical protein
VQLGSVRVVLAGAGRGVIDWSLHGITNVQLDGLRTSLAKLSPTPTPTGHTEHINGIVAIDHIVAMTPNLNRSVKALQTAGLDLRRIREQPTPAGAPRQAFFRLGEVILEIVQEPEEVLAARPDGKYRPACFWGLALLSQDLELTVEQFGEHVSEIRAAVQPGRRIATLRRSAGLSVPVALMSRAGQ